MTGSPSSDLPIFLETLRALDRRLFDPLVPAVITRAPGRLDVMGGIADYSGSLVLQRPIAEATFASLQFIEAPRIEIVSLDHEAQGTPRTYTATLQSLAPGGEPLDYGTARTGFSRERKDHWAAYVVGAFLVLMRERGSRFENGARIILSSTVPEGKGVASSAAVEVATMQAVSAAFKISLQPQDLALLCQMVENLVAGAPCGVMDQMASVFGEADFLMALLCQPAELQSPVRVPSELAFWGLDSGEHHDVGGSAYRVVRTAAFMGYRMIAGTPDRLRGYLANLGPEEFETCYAVRLPEEISGHAFLEQYSDTPDTVTRVDPASTYRVRRATAHPVYEHQRVRAFRDLLLKGTREEDWTSLGELMYQSHASYSACGLGSRGTDIIVDLVRAEGVTQGLYGARITGGGGGGTVAILGRPDASPAVIRIRERYREITGHMPFLFGGTSDGAARFGSFVRKP